MSGLPKLSQKWAGITEIVIIAGAAILLFIHWRQPSGPGGTKLLAATRQILDSSEEIVLLSLEPPYPDGRGAETTNNFHGCRVLGQIEIKDATTKGEVPRAFIQRHCR
jgi:hypothetical protein